jgi:hypothetical protein
MTFLSAGLLAGLIATAIPVALHLLARQQPRRVVFPATRFLKASLDTQRDRLKVRRWWLLAMRIFAIAALAIALARPQIHTVTSEAWFIVAAIALVGLGLLGLATAAVMLGKSKTLRYTLAAAGLFALLGSIVFAGVTMARAPTATLTDDSPGAVAIVIDNSVRSARRVVPDDGDDASLTESTLIDAMKASAQWMVNEQTSDSLIAVIDRSPKPATFAIDHVAAINRIERTEPLAQTAPLWERVRAAVTLVRSSDLERKTVLVITDFTKPSFVVQEWEAAELRTLLSQEPPVSLQFLDLGSDQVTNFSIDQIEISDPTPPRLAESTISVTVKSSTMQERDTEKRLTLQLEMYDTASEAAAGLPVVRDSNVVLPPLRNVDRKTITSAGSSTRTLLAVPPLDVGTHHGIVRIASEDEFATDNTHYVTFVVQPSKRLLIVGADRDEADLLAGALTAPLAVEDPLAEYEIEISEFLPSDEAGWKTFAAVILIDPPLPSPPARSLLEQYVQSGGQLLSLLGPSLASDDPVSAFPAGIVRTWRVPEPGTFLEIIRPNHPAVSTLREIAGSVPWNAFRISQYWQMNVSEDDLIIARYAGTDHPALIERTSSKDANQAGVHFIVTTPLPALATATRGWNRLFSGADAWPAFLLTRNLVDAMVNRGQGNRNLLVGQSTRLTLGDELVSNDVSNSSGVRLQMFPPTGPPVPLLATGGSVTLAQLDAPGTYWLRAQGSSTGVSVNLVPEELELSRIDTKRLSEWMEPEQYTIAKSRDEVRQAAGKGQPTRSLYPAVLLLLLAAFVTEQIIANRFYAARRLSAKTAATSSTSASVVSTKTAAAS